MKQIYSHLGQIERAKIEALIDEGRSNADIALLIGVDRTTVWRERNKRGTPSGYHAKIAQTDYETRRTDCHPKRKIEDGPIGPYVISKLRSGWSPETICGRIEREIRHGLRHKSDAIVTETIYAFVYESDFGKKEKLYEYLRRGKKHRSHRYGRRSQRHLIPNRVGIENRPVIAMTRKTIGHWEGDSIIYPYKQAISSLIERKSRYAVLTKLNRKTAAETTRAIVGGLKNHLCQTLTFDNGSEFTDHQTVAKRLKANTYFCAPYHSWEKGSVENLNGLIRRYLPRGKSIRNLTQSDLNDITVELNDRPRKILGYQSPKEVLYCEYEKLQTVALRMRM